MTDNKEKIYTLIEDSMCHQWYVVPVEDVYESGVYDRISLYSPQRNGKIYLEENFDFNMFYNAMIDKGYDVSANKRISITSFEEFLKTV